MVAPSCKPCGNHCCGCRTGGRCEPGDSGCKSHSYTNSSTESYKRSFATPIMTAVIVFTAVASSKPAELGDLTRSTGAVAPAGTRAAHAAGLRQVLWQDVRWLLQWISALHRAHIHQQSFARVHPLTPDISVPPRNPCGSHARGLRSASCHPSRSVLHRCSPDRHTCSRGSRSNSLTDTWFRTVEVAAPADPCAVRIGAVSVAVDGARTITQVCITAVSGIVQSRMRSHLILFSLDSHRGCGRIRTCTVRGLSPLSLPIGLHIRRISARVPCRT